MRQLLTACIIALAAAVTLQAQQQWHEMVGNPKENFYSIQRRAYEYWKDKDSTEKGVGWKQFKRWEWFWQQRVNPDGSFPSTADNDRLAPESRGKRDQQGVLSNSWQSLGPSSATGGYFGLGRINTVAVHPTDTNRLWVGAAGGGLWRTTDRGATWEPRTDNWPTLGIGDVAYAPSNPQVMYVATGDPYSSDYYSIGLRKSTNGGETWAETGLQYNITDQVRMNRIAVHPQTPNRLLVGSSDGLWRSTNGGTTWTRTITNSWIRDIELHPSEPSIAYAVTNNGSVLRSTDFGLSWNASTLVNSVNPTRGQLAVSRSNAAVVYAVFSTSGGSFEGLYRSLDTGKTFSKQSGTPNILNGSSDGSGGGGQGWYDLSMTVDPQNHNVLIVGAVNLWRSTNGGTSWNIIGYWRAGGLPPSVPEIHADHHFLTYDNRSILYVCNDGGLYFSYNKGNSYVWKSDGIVNMQFYRLGIAPNGSTIAGAQDNSSRLYKQQQWYEALGTGDGMDCDADPQNSSILYTSSYYGSLRRTNSGGRTRRDWSQIANRESIGEDAAWIAPYEVNPNDGKMITAGFVNVWRSIDSGRSWSQQGVLNNTRPLTALAVAPSNPNVIYASTGLVHWVTTDAGTSWSALSSLPSLYVSSIAVHPSNPARVWFTSSNFTAGQKVFLSNNYGATVSNTSGGLPNVPSNTLVVDTVGGVDRLYVGTDIGVWTKRYADADWAAYNEGLPNVIVNDLKIWHSARRLRAATYGRGLFDVPLIAVAPPVAQFSMSQSKGCAPLSINFYDLSTGLPHTLEWDFNGDGTVDTNTQNPSFLFTKPGEYTVRLRVRNTAGESVTEKTIQVYAPMQLSLPDTIMVCGQDSLEIDGGGVTGGSGEYEWEWNINRPFKPLGRSKIIIFAPIDAHLTVTVKDDAGCRVAKRVFVGLSNLQISDVGNDTLCPGGMRTISPKVSGGKPPYSWQWGNHSAIHRVVSQGIVEVSATESTTITVAVTDALKCSTTFTIHVPVGPRFAISMPDPIVACKGLAVELSPTVQGDLGQSFSWTPAQGLSNPNILNPVVQPGAAGTWTLVARSRYGCLDTRTVVVTRIEQALGNITSDRGTKLCPGDSLIFTAPAGAQKYRWNTGHTSRSIRVRYVGEYFCKMDSGECDAVTDTVSVVYGEKITTPWSVLIETAGSFALNCTTDADHYRWYRDGELMPNDTLRRLPITQNGSYVVRTWDDDRCYADSDPYVVTVMSVAEQRSTDEPVLYPNPVAEQLTVEWGQGWAPDDELTLECRDLQGRRLFAVTVNASDRRTVMPVGSLASGSYSLYVVSGAKRVVLPFIRQ